jgi:hypothetical protein
VTTLPAAEAGPGDGVATTAEQVAPGSEFADAAASRADAAQAAPLRLMAVHAHPDDESC